MAEVVLDGVSKRFGATEAVRDVSLTVADREFCVFVGPSGCGKSTLLRLIAGLEDPSAGRILFDGERIDHRAPAKRGVAMVFQSYALYPHMTVRENMAFGLKGAKMGRDGVAERVDAAARTLRLDGLLDRKPRQLSGGQRQRVAIGRAIVREPRVFLFDEPLSNLDASLRVEMRVEIARLHRALDATMIYVTHDQVEAMTLADRIVVLDDGRVEQIGAPIELYERPRNAFVAGFIGSPRMNVLDARAVGRDADGITVEVAGGTTIRVPVPPGSAAPGDRLRLGLRPEHLALGAAEPAIAGEVVAVERLGSGTLVHVAVAGASPVVVALPGSPDLAVGARVAVAVDAGKAHLFDDAGNALGPHGGVGG